ncbi:DMT family transporter [Companilactobacillus sp.]|uniref:DMT family transporter n=1 Tax=Companilactobacillus sp. TaxID=2767905 RepID=UPI0025C16D59|nr:DMT family transporter [Companilactobacillus sp.]MCH4010011.1 DMT family transporter [Companilactobacillus sp.]MCH4052313.1 DMT family transporter [Companilactobacillus sp.]MCH4077953.1 DMT family transporter [Companilactobacillus sp.]MCH4126529.1 DMT family transporter [Companilactobacillus sp.]MCH4132115.1 DMT family transporter [Companilactobacillus sp.]
MKIKSILLILIPTFLFSSMEIALKIAGGSFNPIELNFIRFLIGGLALLPFAWAYLRKHSILLSKTDLLRCAATGFVIVVVSMSLYQLSIQLTDASIVAIMLSANPIFGLIIGFIFLKEKLSRTNIFALVLTLIGLLVIIDPFHLKNPIGITLGLLSSIIFGVYGVMSRVHSHKIGINALTMTCLSFLFGAGELAILMGLSHTGLASFIPKNYSEFVNIPFFQGITWSTLPLILYISVLVTGAAFGLYFVAMDEVGVVQASLIFLVKPALAPILALGVLGEAIVPRTIVGIVIILLGSAITLVGAKIAYGVISIFISDSKKPKEEVERQMERDMENLPSDDQPNKNKLTAKIHDQLENQKEVQAELKEEIQSHRSSMQEQKN